MPWSVPGMPKCLTTSSGNCFLSLVNAVFTPLLSFSVFANLIHINAAFCCWFLLMLCDMIATMIKKSRSQSEQDTALQLRYGKIGIGAVAAAAPYQSGGKRPLRVRLPYQNLTISVVVAATSATNDLERDARESS
jgi:hypothetical protein